MTMPDVPSDVLNELSASIRSEIHHGTGFRTYEPYPSYKDSCVEWLGQIPAHWEVKRLKHLATINDEALPESTDPSLELAYVDISSVDAVKGITQTENITYENAPSRARRIVQRGDVIISTVRTYLRAIAPIERPEPNLVVSTGFAIIRPKDLLSSFAAHALSSPYFVDRVVANSFGANYPTINPSMLVCLEVAYPPLPEQRAIADHLDRETARIDTLMEKKERLIELLREKRAALISQAVTRGLDPNVPLKDSGIKWLGHIPAHWDMRRLGRLTPSDRQIMYGIVLPGPHVEDGVPIVKGGDVSHDRLRLNRLNRTAKTIESRYARSRLSKGDLVYAIRGSIGEVAMVPEDLEGANLTQDAARVAYTDTTDGLWLLYVLKAPAVFAQLEAGALGATIRGINIRDLKRASIPVPIPTEQRAIASYLDCETSRIDALVDRVREAIDRLKEFRAALISAAVTGKIDVRDQAA